MRINSLGSKIRILTNLLPVLVLSHVDITWTFSQLRSAIIIFVDKKEVLKLCKKKKRDNKIVRSREKYARKDNEKSILRMIEII